MKKYLFSIISIFILGIAVTKAAGVPIYVPSAPGANYTLQSVANGTYRATTTLNVATITATSTTATSTFAGNTSLATTTINTQGDDGLIINASNSVHTVRINQLGSLTGNHLSFTSPETGTTLTDGLQVGLEAADGLTAQIKQNENSPLEFYTNNLHRMTILAGGNVGIGTTTPIGKLDIVGGSVGIAGTSASDVMRLNGSTAGSGITIESLNMARTAYRPITMYGTNYSFTNSGTPLVTFLSTGNVGIGTTSPSTLLDIQTGTFKNVRFFPAVAGIGGVPAGVTNLGPAISLSRPTDGLNLNSFFIMNGTDTGFSSRSNYHFFTNGTEKLTILENGNVGIGTTTPTAALSVQTLGAGNAMLNITSSAYGANIGVSGGSLANILYLANPETRMYTSTANAQLTMFDSGQVQKNILSTNGNSYINGGNLGIGTTSPFAKLSVAGDAYIGGNFTATGTATITGLTTTGSLKIGALNGLLLGTAGTVSAISTSSLGLLGSSTVSSLTANYLPKWGGSAFGNSAVYDNAGKVGIGTTTPNQKLSVIGASTAVNNGMEIGVYQSRKWNLLSKAYNVGNDKYNFDISPVDYGGDLTFMTNGAVAGNVGIGTTTPATRLQIDGGNATTTLSVTSTNGATHVTTLGAKIILQDMSGGTCSEITTQSGVISARAVVCP